MPFAGGCLLYKSRPPVSLSRSHREHLARWTVKWLAFGHPCARVAIQSAGDVAGRWVPATALSYRAGR